MSYCPFNISKKIDNFFFKILKKFFKENFKNFFKSVSEFFSIFSRRTYEKKNFFLLNFFNLFKSFWAFFVKKYFFLIDCTYFDKSHGFVVQPSASKIISFSDASVVSKYRLYAKYHSWNEPSRNAVQYTIPFKFGLILKTMSEKNTR